MSKHAYTQACTSTRYTDTHSGGYRKTDREREIEREREWNGSEERGKLAGLEKLQEERAVLCVASYQGWLRRGTILRYGGMRGMGCRFEGKATLSRRVLEGVSRKSSACKLRGTRPDAVALPPTVAILENSPTSRVTDEASTGNPSTVKRQLVVLPSVIHPLLLFFSRVLLLVSSHLTFSLSQFLLVSLFCDLTLVLFLPLLLRLHLYILFHRSPPFEFQLRSVLHTDCIRGIRGCKHYLATGPCSFYKEDAPVYIRPDWLVCCPFVCTCVSFAMGVWLVGRVHRSGGGRRNLR